MQIQLRHAPLTNDFVSDQVEEFFSLITADTLDQCWIGNNATGEEYYSVGNVVNGQVSDNIDVPAEFNGLPVRVMHRGGGWTWHGPGQISLVLIVNVRRLVKYSTNRDLPRQFCELLTQYLNAEYDADLVYNVDDPGIYTQTGAKVASFGGHMPVPYWMAFKCSINVNVANNFDKFQAIEVCDASNRTMANLLPDAVFTDAQYAEFGESVARGLINLIYDDITVLT